jgi:A/G-specific adenine glycosylase
MNAASLLLNWFAADQRELPWRRTRDPWAILVSESMLQQTQVARVMPRYNEFIELFPTPTACAAAPLSAIVRAWQGLGYNRRALQLHRTATAVRDDWDGVMPRDIDALLSLPGIGPYTARAVATFAYEQEGVGVVDTNAARVLARAFAGRTLDRRAVQALADEVVPVGEAWRWNQAMLDLGASMCRKRPNCDACPLVSVCAWRLSGADEDPAIASAGVSTPQSTFAGSDRQGRGRLITALRLAPVDANELASVMGWPDDADRTERVLQTLVNDGLVVRNAQHVQLAD